MRSFSIAFFDVRPDIVLKNSMSFVLDPTIQDPTIMANLEEMSVNFSGFSAGQICCNHHLCWV